MHDPRLAEAIVFDALDHAAQQGLPCPTTTELSFRLGYSEGGAVVAVMKRLEKRGLIEVERYQRERRVKILETGMQTAPVRNPAPHWRDRPRPSSPGPSLSALRQRDPGLTQRMIVTARHEGMAFDEFVARMAAFGFETAFPSIQRSAENQG